MLALFPLRYEWGPIIQSEFLNPAMHFSFTD